MNILFKKKSGNSKTKSNTRASQPPYGRNIKQISFQNRIKQSIDFYTQLKIVFCWFCMRFCTSWDKANRQKNRLERCFLNVFAINLASNMFFDHLLGSKIEPTWSYCRGTDLINGGGDPINGTTWDGIRSTGRGADRRWTLGGHPTEGAGEGIRNWFLLLKISNSFGARCIHPIRCMAGEFLAWNHEEVHSSFERL